MCWDLIFFFSFSSSWVGCGIHFCCSQWNISPAYFKYNTFTRIPCRFTFVYRRRRRAACTTTAQPPDRRALRRRTDQSITFRTTCEFDVRRKRTAKLRDFGARLARPSIHCIRLQKRSVAVAQNHPRTRGFVFFLLYARSMVKYIFLSVSPASMVFYFSVACVQSKPVFFSAGWRRSKGKGCANIGGVDKWKY